MIMSSMEAKSVQEKLRKNKNSGLYAIITSFGLANATLMANVEIVLLVLSILIIIFVGILAYQQIKRLTRNCFNSTFNSDGCCWRE